MINMLFVLGGAILIEIITLIIRFGFGLTSKNVQHKMGFPVRVHHMYIGLAVMFTGVYWSFPFLFIVPITLLEIGFAVFLSDVIHHFIMMPVLHKDIDFPF